MNNAELAAMLRELDVKAEPGPWAQTWGDDDPVIDAPGRSYFICDEGGHNGSDAALIVALRNNLPAIIAALEKDQADD